MLSAAAFTLFGITHLSILSSLAIIGLVCIGIGRHFSITVQNAIAWSIACVLIISKITRLSIAWYDQDLKIQNALPMHLCDWATIVIVLALFLRKQGLYELAYFWGFAGTIQALLTPDLKINFPDPRFILFFISHGFIIIGVCYMTFALNFYPKRGALKYAFVWTQVYILITMLANYFTHSNYGYLSHKPEGASLLDYLGLWPWYIASMEAVAFLLFTIFYLPYFLRKKNS